MDIEERLRKHYEETGNLLDALRDPDIRQELIQDEEVCGASVGAGFPAYSESPQPVDPERLERAMSKMRAEAASRLTKGASEPKRMSISLPPREAGLLEELSKAQGVTQVEALRRSIATEAYFQEQLRIGGRVLIDMHGQIKEVVFR